MNTKFSILLSALILSAAITISSCSKGDEGDPNKDPACNGCETILAKALYDSLQPGVYKGLLLTGTGIGHFRVNVKNGNDDFFMVMKFTRDGNYQVLNDSLRPTGTVTITPGSDMNANLLGSASSTTIYVGWVGLNPHVSDFTLSGSIGTGPKPQATVMKETSDQQVKVFEGTMQETSASSANGKVGFVVRGNNIEGTITNANNSLRESFFDGTVGTDKKFSFSFSGNNSTYSGEFTNDNTITGTFTINGVNAGTFTASRTL